MGFFFLFLLWVFFGCFFVVVGFRFLGFFWFLGGLGFFFPGMLSLPRGGLGDAVNMQQGRGILLHVWQGLIHTGFGCTGAAPWNHHGCRVCSLL